MRQSQPKNALFHGQKLAKLFSTRIDNARRHIKNESDDHLLNTNETEYLAYIKSLTQVERVELDVTRISVSIEKRLIPAERFPPDGFIVKVGQSYEKEVFIFHIPFIGNKDLFTYQPNIQSTGYSLEAKLHQNELTFETIKFYNETEVLAKEKDKALEYLKKMTQFANQDVEQFNSTLEYQLKRLLIERKRTLAKS